MTNAKGAARAAAKQCVDVAKYCHGKCPRPCAAFLDFLEFGIKTWIYNYNYAAGCLSALRKCPIVFRHF